MTDADDSRPKPRSARACSTETKSSQGLNSNLDRRSLLRSSLMGAAAIGATGALSGCDDNAVAQVPPPAPPPTAPSGPPAGIGAGDVFGQAPSTRAMEARLIKMEAAQANADAHPTTLQTNNGDEALYGDFRASFSKTLFHNSLGEVDLTGYTSYLAALRSGDPADFDNIIIGSAGAADRFGLVSPQAAYAFELCGMDGQAGRMPPAPTFASAETAAEMVELYWYALCRDVPFARYDTDPTIAAAVADLNALPRADIFPQEAGGVTPQTLFRSSLPGATTGPLISQFLLQPFFFGAYEITQSLRRVAEGGVNQFMTDFDAYLSVQNGRLPTVDVTFDSVQTYLYSMRQLGEFVHVDTPIQSPTYAASILFNLGVFDPSVADAFSASEEGFVSFGKADINHLVTRGPRHALTAAWYQKWLVHRRLRPEVYGCRINVMQRGLKSYDIHPDVMNSDALARINAAQSNPDNRGLLPMGYPEGCPAHPAYPGGHSTFSAAAATIIKGFFDDAHVFENPVQPSADGLSLEPWTGAPLTVGGELNKLVGNITHGRDGAGMHWRSDGLGNFIGEDVGISILADYSRTYNERFDGFTLTKFNGERILIADGQVTTL